MREPLRERLRERLGLDSSSGAFLERRLLAPPVILRERRRERLDLREPLRDFLDLREPLRDFLDLREPLRERLRERLGLVSSFDAFLERRLLAPPVILRERRRERLDLREALREVRFDLREPLRDFLDLRERFDLREAFLEPFLERRRLPPCVPPHPAPVILRERRRERLDLREVFFEERFDLREPLRERLDLREVLRERLDFLEPDFDALRERLLLPYCPLSFERNLSTNSSDLLLLINFIKPTIFTSVSSVLSPFLTRTLNLFFSVSLTVILIKFLSVSPALLR